MCIYKISHI